TRPEWASPAAGAGSRRLGLVRAFVLQRRPLLVEPLPLNPAHLVHAQVVPPGDGEPRVLDAGALVLGGDEVGRLDGPAWFAARIDSTARNELGGQLFAHTSPVYVDLAGGRAFDVEAARLM